MSEEIKPCPFCGNNGDLWVAPAEDAFAVECVSDGEICGMLSPARDSREEAIAAWNSIAVLNAGEVVVPEKCTDDMFFEAINSRSSMDDVPHKDLRAAINAAIAARPKGGTE